MSLSIHLIARLDAAVAASRRVIERIPESIYEWQPHEKSWNTLDLATHIANLVSWGPMMLTTDEIDFASPEMQNWTPPTADTVAEVLETLAGNAEQVRTILAGLSDEDLEREWVMRNGEEVIVSDPRASAFDHWVLAHQAHHRGELMVYLRMNDVPLPAIFGPTADEQGM